MKVIPREPRRITYSSDIRKLKIIPLTKYQREIIIGSVLGDGYLVPNWSKTNYALKITRSGKQKEYVEWQYESLKPFVLKKPRWYERTQSYTIGTISHSEITKLYSIFYPNGKKIIPNVMAEYIQSPLTLAVWFMDDGNVVKNKEGKVYGYHLNTQSFSVLENKMLVGMFQNQLGIKCTIQKNNGYVRLYINSESKNKFAKLIKPFVIPSMQYKLG